MTGYPEPNQALRAFLKTNHARVLDEVADERVSQDAKWGEQNHPDVPTDDPTEWVRGHYASQADVWKVINDNRVKDGTLTWDGILLEEVYEALAETDPALMRAELVQVAAVAVAWIEAIDRRVAKARESYWGPNGTPPLEQQEKRKSITAGKFITKDSGAREEFESGARRDTQEGKPRYALIPAGPLKRLAEQMARGAVKYGEDNWTKGMPASRFLESLMRHVEAYRLGDHEEDHLAAVLFNAMAIMHFEGTTWDDLNGVST